MKRARKRKEPRWAIPGWAFTACLDAAMSSPGWPVHVHTDNARTVDESAIDTTVMERVRIVRLQPRKRPR